MTTVMNKRYQTSRPSLSLINIPRIAVKPARKTAICNWISAFFMRLKDKSLIGLMGKGFRGFVWQTPQSAALAGNQDPCLIIIRCFCFATASVLLGYCFENLRYLLEQEAKQLHGSCMAVANNKRAKDLIHPQNRISKKNIKNPQPQTPNTKHEYICQPLTKSI